MKLTRKEFLKTLCAIPFMACILPKEKLKDDLSSVLLIPPELEAEARKVMFLMPIQTIHRGDAVSLDDNWRLTPFRGNNPILGMATDVKPNGLVEVEVNRRVRRGHG